MDVAYSSVRGIKASADVTEPAVVRAPEPFLLNSAGELHVQLAYPQRVGILHDVPKVAESWLQQKPEQEPRDGQQQQHETHDQHVYQQKDGKDDSDHIPQAQSTSPGTRPLWKPWSDRQEQWRCHGGRRLPTSKRGWQGLPL